MDRTKSCLPNVSYLFVPFNFKQPEDFKKTVSEFDRSERWAPVKDRLKYMLKYVSDKFDTKDKDRCQCFHYRLNSSFRSELGIAAEDEWYSLNPKQYCGNKKEIFRFRILDIDVFCFNTSVCIMSFRLHFEKNDPFWIAAAQFYIKKVSAELIFADSQCSAVCEKTTVLEIAKRVAEFKDSDCSFDFFCYSNETRERANLLTYLETEDKEDYKKELFSLRRCYNDGFLYFEDEEADKNEIYIPSPDTVWGITSEAAVCLVCPDKGRGNFIRSVFFENFGTQYLFTYVLLLHQKYALYTFLSRIGAGTGNDLETLEKYKQQLYEFETDFVFSYITEVPQYQNLYDRVSAAFRLKQIYEDVNEPLRSLADVRRADTDKKEKDRDDRVNKVLFIVSLLSIFSILVDGHSYIKELLTNVVGPAAIRNAQIAFAVLIAGLAAWTVISLFRARKK